jgi:hypothetical protein
VDTTEDDQLIALLKDAEMESVGDLCQEWRRSAQNNRTVKHSSLVSNTFPNSGIRSHSNIANWQKFICSARVWCELNWTEEKEKHSLVVSVCWIARMNLSVHFWWFGVFWKLICDFKTN